MYYNINILVSLRITSTYYFILYDKIILLYIANYLSYIKKQYVYYDVNQK